MNQILKKTSFVSGLLLLFTPIIFSTVLKFILNFKNFLYTFSPDQIVLYITFLIIILELFFFIKIFKAYYLHEPHVYYLIYFIGILSILGILKSSLLGKYQYLQIIKMIFFSILLFALFSFRYQKENFITTNGPSGIRNNVLTLLILAIIVGIISYYLSIYFISERFVFPYFLSALVSLILIPWWKKKVASGVLHNFIFLPGFFIIVTHLILELFAFYSFFKII